MKTVKEEDKRALEDELDRWNNELAYQMQFEWMITKESLAAFRAMAPYFVFKQPDPIIGMGSNQDASDLFHNRFLQGQISVEQFLKELDQKMLMIEREN